MARASFLFYIYVMDTLLTILAIVDNPVTVSTVQQALDAGGGLAARYTLARRSDVLTLLGSNTYDCVLLEAEMYAENTQETLCAVRKAHPQSAVVALLPAQFEPFGSDTLAAEQYLPLPVMTPDRLAASVRAAVRARQRAALKAAGAAEAANAQHRLRLLMDVSRALAEHHDLHAGLTELASHMVDSFADWCAIDIVEAGERVRVGFAEQPHEDKYSGVSNERNDEHADAALQIRVPLLAREQTLGTLTLGRNDPSRQFMRADHELAEEIARRIAGVVDNTLLYRTAQESFRARDVFLSVAAHELKTPLTALLGYATLLKRRLERGIQQPERDLRGVNIMVEQAQRLSKLLNTLLEISRMPHAPVSLEQSQCNLSQLARRVAEEMGPLLRYHTLEVDIPVEDIRVTGDTERLEMVLHNLLHNAVQYSPAGGAIVVSLVQNDSEACLSVKDNGVGIPHEALPRIFGRFYRANDTSVHTATGMGVGLYIVKQIVESHGGYVDVQSVEGLGSTFTVCLPLCQPHEQANKVSP